MQEFAAIEYDMGLLDTDNQPKPVGLRLQSLIAEFRATPPAAVPRTTALIVPDNIFGQPSDPPGWQFASRYMKYAAEGMHPALALESRCEDRAYLAARGITELIR